jgi:hypothetical protein
MAIISGKKLSMAATKVIKTIEINFIAFIHHQLHYNTGFVMTNNLLNCDI